MHASCTYPMTYPRVPTLLLQCDVTNEREVQGLVNATLAKYESVHVVVNCAGVFARGSFADTPAMVWPCGPMIPHHASAQPVHSQGTPCQGTARAASHTSTPQHAPCHAMPCHPSPCQSLALHAHSTPHHLGLRACCMCVLGGGCMKSSAVVYGTVLSRPSTVVRP